MENEFPFPHLKQNILHYLIHAKDFAAALAYLVTFKNFKDLSITAKNHSVEISNSEISISVIIYAGFEAEEYLELQNKHNVHFVTLSQTITKMIEFKNIPVKYIDKMAWFFSVISHSENEESVLLNRLVKLDTK